jgi:Protein of unknown function (DUF3253)
MTRNDDAPITGNGRYIIASGRRWRAADPGIPDSLRRELVAERSPEATICPSDAARIVGGESWRDLMDAAREVAAALAREGIVAVRQHGADADLADAVGPVRLARGPDWLFHRSTY